MHFLKDFILDFIKDFTKETFYWFSKCFLSRRSQACYISQTRENNCKSGIFLLQISNIPNLQKWCLNGSKSFILRAMATLVLLHFYDFLNDFELRILWYLVARRALPSRRRMIFTNLEDSHLLPRHAEAEAIKKFYQNM